MNTKNILMQIKHYEKICNIKINFLIIKILQKPNNIANKNAHQKVKDLV